MNLLSLIDSLVTLFFVVSFAFKVTLSGHIMKGINDGRNHSLSVSGSKNYENSSSSFQSSKLVPPDNKLKVQNDLPQGVSEEKGAGCSIKVEHGLKVGMSEKVGSKRIRLEISASSAPLENGVICASTADLVLQAPIVAIPQDGEMIKSYIQNDGSEKDIHAAHRRSIDNTETSEVSATSLEGQRKPALDQAVLPAMTKNLVSSDLEEDRGNLKARVYRELGEECCTDVQLRGAPWMTSVGSGANACVSCKFGGSLLCCNGEQNYHLKYLDPPLKNVPVGVWHCVCCAKKKVVSGMHSLSGGVWSILDAKEVELSDSEVGVQKQYLVKNRSLAHVHNSWVPELQLEALVLV